MAITLIATASASPGNPGGTTAAITTTGANLLVWSVSWWEGGGTLATPSDSKSNTWIPLTKHGPGQYATHRFWYAKNAIVGTGHTFTAAGTGTYATQIVHAFSGADLTAPFDGESGASTANGPTSLASGNVTPSQNGCVIVTGYSCMTNPGNSVGSETVTPSMTMVNVGNQATGRALTGTLIQSTAAAINPTWSWTGSLGGVAVSTGVFLPGAPPVTETAQPYVWGPV